MNNAADWMVVVGLLLTASGVCLRVFMMMRSSDAQPANAAPAGGRSLLSTYRTTFPKSRLPLVMWAALSIGLVLLIAGLLLEFR